MSQKPNFNRTRSTTTPLSPWIENISNASNESDIEYDTWNSSRFDKNSTEDQSPQIMFYLLITLPIPSIICFIFLFYNFARLPHLRTKSTNLLIMCVLMINFIHMLADLPFRLYFLSENRVVFFQSIFCLIWTWYDSILTTADLLIMSFTSIERYFSIFHHLYILRHERLFYKIPIILCIFVPTMWYTVLIFAYPCQNSFSYLTFQCGTMCYLTNSQVFINFENFIFFMFPLFVIVVGNCTLIICVLIQKANMRRKHRLNLWRNNLRMISQLMFIALLYMSIYVPSCILLIFGSYVRRTRFQPWAVSVRTRYFTHLKYLIIFGCPFVMLAGQKELHQTIKNLFIYVKRQRPSQWKRNIHPMTIMNTNNRKENEPC